MDISLLSERSQIPESALTSGITGKHDLALSVQRKIYIYTHIYINKIYRYMIKKINQFPEVFLSQVTIKISHNLL